MRANLERKIADRLSENLGTFGKPPGFSRAASAPKEVAFENRYPTEPPPIPERVSEAFRVPQVPDNLPEFVERKERRSKVKACIDSLLKRLAGLGQMSESYECPLEIGDRCSVGRARE